MSHVQRLKTSSSFLTHLRHIQVYLQKIQLEMVPSPLAHSLNVYYTVPYKNTGQTVQVWPGMRKICLKTKKNKIINKISWWYTLT